MLRLDALCSSALEYGLAVGLDLLRWCTLSGSLYQAGLSMCNSAFLLFDSRCSMLPLIEICTKSCGWNENWIMKVSVFLYQSLGSKVLKLKMEACFWVEIRFTVFVAKYLTYVNRCRVRYVGEHTSSVTVCSARNSSSPLSLV